MSIWSKFVEDINDFGFKYAIPDDVDYFCGVIPFNDYKDEWVYYSIEEVKEISERFEKKEKVMPKRSLMLFVKMKDGHAYTVEHDDYNYFWWRNLD